jgi:hypothetical protein
MAQRTAFIVFFGLDTPATSECYGLRPFAEGQRDLLNNGSVTFFFEWNHTTYEDVIEATKGFGRLVLMGHSFGGAFLKHFLNRATRDPLAPQIDLAVFFDPAPNLDQFGQFFSWQSADQNLRDRWYIPTIAIRALCFYQRNQVIIPGLVGVCGVPFVPSPIVPDLVLSPDHTTDVVVNPHDVVNVNVTKLGLQHCDMLGDPTVQAITANVILATP